MAFDGLHQGAGLGLVRGTAFAVAVADYLDLQRIDSLGTRRKAVSCEKAEIQRLLAFDPFKLRHDAGQRAYVLSKASDGLRWRYRAIAVARHNGLAADAEPDRRRSAIGIPHVLAAARRALRPGSHIMSDDRRAQQIEADDIVVQVGAKAAGNGLGDLGRRQPDRAWREQIFAERRRDHAGSVLPIEKCLDLAVPFHAIGEAAPTGALSRPENRTDQGKNSRGLHRQPFLLLRQPLTVEFGKLAVEIVVHQNDSQIGRVIDHPNAEFAQSGLKLALAGRSQ